MIVLFETSALLARRVRGDATDGLITLYSRTIAGATSRIAEAEVAAAFAAKLREGAAKPEAVAAAAALVRRDLSRMFVVPADDREGRLVEALHARRELGAAAAVHLAAALRLAELAGSRVLLATLDRGLAAAAAAEGLDVGP